MYASEELVTGHHVLFEVILPIRDLVASIYRATISPRIDMFGLNMTHQLMVPTEIAHVCTSFPLALENLVWLERIAGM